jgi:hypothetical protein
VIQRKSARQIVVVEVGAVNAARHAISCLHTTQRNVLSI